MLLSKLKNINKIREIYKKPIDEIAEPSYNIQKPNVLHETDVLYITNDNGRKYIISVIDTHNSLCESRALTSISMTHCCGALTDIYEKSKYLQFPTCLQADNAFDNPQFKNWCDENKMKLKITQPHYHRTNAHVERLNQTLGKYIWLYQVDKELDTGKPYTKWLAIYQEIIKELNDRRLDNLDKNYERINKVNRGELPLLNKNNNQIIDVGTKVRLALDEPQSLQGKKYANNHFRSTDHHWQTSPIYEIVEHYLIEGSPPMYKIKNVNTNEIFKALVPSERLQVIKHE